MWQRVYIDVIAEHREDGTVLPRAMTWVDDRKFQIDRVSAIKPAAAQNSGGHGIRYTVIVRGQTRYLFREGDRWFVEHEGPIRKADGA